MVSRVPAKHLFRHILRFGTGAALALSLFCTGFSGSSALASTPYNMNMGDECEGDPGDGVLSPQATGIDKDLSAVPLDENVIPVEHGYFLVHVFINWASPGTANFRFLLVPQSGDGVVIGTSAWYSTFSGRWWNHAR